MTENVSKRFTDFDQWPMAGAVKAMYEGQVDAIAAIKPALDAIARAAEQAAERLGKDGRLVYVGAGTSGRLAVQDGAELVPTFSWPASRLVYGMAGGMEALTVSAEGAEDCAKDGADLMRAIKITDRDVVIGVAASGTTPFTCGALEQARAMGALTVGIANNPDTPVLKAVAHPILAETGSEIIAGSTRMKAGTAQKAILNMISTAIMTKRGHVYKGYMVDMSVSNVKLEKRAVNMVSDLADCSSAQAAAALKQAGGCVKPAVLIALGRSPQQAALSLEKMGGSLRKALGEAGA